MTARTGPWREALVSGFPIRWGVHDGTAYALTAAGRIRTFGRRAHAYAHAEALNRREAERQAEELAALGL